MNPAQAAGGQDAPNPDTATHPGDIELDPLEWEEDGYADAASIPLPKLQMTQLFVNLLRSASLVNCGMDLDDILNMRNPEPGYDLVEPSSLLRFIQHFINNTGSSRDHYEMLWEIEQQHNPQDPILSFDQVKRRVRWLSGVVPIEHDMCLDSCVAYTGPYDELQTCPCCSTPQYVAGDNKKPQKRFSTIPVGPVIQALYGSCDIAEHMHYLEQRLAQNVEHVRVHGRLDKYNDTACSQELLDAWHSGSLKNSDVALQFSIDGAQLTVGLVYNLRLGFSSG